MNASELIHQVRALTVQIAEVRSIEVERKDALCLQRARLIATAPRNVVTEAWRQMAVEDQQSVGRMGIDHSNTRRALEDWVNLWRKDFVLELGPRMVGDRAWWQSIPVRVVTVLDRFVISPATDEEDRDLLGQDRHRHGATCRVALDLEA